MATGREGQCYRDLCGRSDDLELEEVGWMDETPGLGHWVGQGWVLGERLRLLALAMGLAVSLSVWRGWGRGVVWGKLPSCLWMLDLEDTWNPCRRRSLWSGRDRNSRLGPGLCGAKCLFSRHHRLAQYRQCLSMASGLRPVS